MHYPHPGRSCYRLISLLIGYYSVSHKAEVWTGRYFRASAHIGGLLVITTVFWIYSRRKWQPTPVFLPRESCGQRNLVGCCLQGRTESDTTPSFDCWVGKPWRRAWQPTPVFSPGESPWTEEPGGLHGVSKVLDTPEWLTLSLLLT